MQNEFIGKKIPQSFYAINTLDLAKALLGKIFCHHLNGIPLCGKIVETEAYITPHDEACHAHRGKTPRNAPMFGPAGSLYVYFTYGNHFMLNIVAEPEGNAAAVLIRALEPISGIEIMQTHRNMQEIKQLTNGPGKLTQALQINRRHSGLSLQSDVMFLCESNQYPPFEIGSSTRVGITKSRHFPWRYFIKHNPYVSKGKPS